MGTPITVSSTSTVAPNKSDFLQLNYSPNKNEGSVISLDSTSFERVPVSWKTGNNAFTRTESNTTLTNIQKVSNWIKSIEGEEPKNDNIVVDLENNITDVNFTESVKSEEIPKNNVDSKSVILYRCDFNKSVTAKTYYPPLSSFKNSTPLINYFKYEDDQKVTSSIPNISNNHVGLNDNNLKISKRKVMKKHLLLKRPDTSKIINYSQMNNKFSIEKESYTSKMNDEKSDGSSEVCEVPMSPESRKKKELCSYLQLMNPADKKERFILQNRRSTRVRNLAAMQEKRKMELKIKESEMQDPEPTEKEVEKCATSKSFKELNIRLEDAKFSREFLAEKLFDFELEKDSFCFPFPSKDITEKVVDFDSTMSKLVPRYKRICKLKNLKLNCKVKLVQSTPKNKENLIKKMIKNKPKKINITQNVKTKKSNINKSSPGHKLKDILKNKYKQPTSDRTNTLRSNGKLKNVTLKKLIGKKETELKQRRNLRRKELRERQQLDKTKLKRPKKTPSTTSSRRNSKLRSSNSQCEIVTVAENNEDVDLENFMDDLIDFNNLSEEHKKCLIESRILSTKPMPQVSSTNTVKEEISFSSLDTASPLYGFNKADINEVEKICVAYKNSVKNSKTEIMQSYFCHENEIKVEETKLNDVEYKTDNIHFESPEVKLSRLIPDDNLSQAFTELGDNKLEIKNDLEENTIFSINNEVPSNGITLQEHNYAGLLKMQDEEVDVVTVPSKNIPVRGCIEINPRSIARKSKFELLPYNKSVEMKSLHRSLQHLKKKNNNSLSVHNFVQEWNSDVPSSQKTKTKKQSHYISINKENGAVLKAFYIDYNLIVCQEYMVSFWMQTPLGNVLGSQNMWIPRGETQRLVLNSKCIQKESMEMVIAMETHVAYIELWTKEHKSEIREGPVADVFATVYFWKQRQSGLVKKVLQLENINGFADDVQYSVMKCCPKIIVSWHSANEDNVTKRTFIHSYQLAADYQTVSNIYDIEPVDHYVSSLHNIEDCDNLIMGCGENKITLWNVEYGYIVATIELSEIKSPLSTLWVKCDRGFLFALQQCVDRELRLIAINGINHSWKKLASYNPSEGFDRLRGVCIENGLLLSFYDQGILCWKAETGEPVEESNVEAEIIPSGKYVILLEDNQIIVKHAVTHLMSMSVDET